MGWFPGGWALSGMVLEGLITQSGRPAAAPPSRLAHEAVVAEYGSHPGVELRAVAARCEHRRSRRPCHPRAITSGNERYPAVNHGHFEEAVALGAGF
jgi:hypothetical protein